MPGIFCFGGYPCSNERVIWKEANAKTRKRIENDLKSSAMGYADRAENKLSKLQKAYLRKYQPQQHAYSGNVSQHPQDAPNKRFGRVSALFRGRRDHLREHESARPAPSDEGNADVTKSFLGLLNQPLALVSDDNCREAVAILNRWRLFRAEILRDGYDVTTFYSPYLSNIY
jgi:hypothetical protein